MDKLRLTLDASNSKGRELVCEQFESDSDRWWELSDKYGDFISLRNSEIVALPPVVARDKRIVALEAQVKALVDEVRAVEWVTDVDDLGGTYLYCPRCFAAEGALGGDGHEPDCPRQAALPATEG